MDLLKVKDALNDYDELICAVGDSTKGAAARLEDAVNEVDAAMKWRPMSTAPRNCTVIRLLVEFTSNAMEDTREPAPTIGCNNFDNDGEDTWLFAGWSWEHDCFTQGEGVPVGWLPMIDIGMK